MRSTHTAARRAVVTHVRGPGRFEQLWRAGVPAVSRPEETARPGVIVAQSFLIDSKNIIPVGTP